MKAKILTCTIYFHSSHLGKPIDSIQLPQDCYFLGIVRASRLIHTHENPTVQEGDALIAIAMNPALSPSLENVLQLKKKVA